MQEQRRGSVSDSLGVDGMQDAKIVDLPRGLGEQLGNLTSGLPVTSKLPGGLHHALRRSPFTCLGDRTRIVKRHHLVMLLREQRLVIERIDVTRSALHEQEDDALGARLKVWLLVHQRIGRGGRFSRKALKCQITEAASGRS